MTTEPAARPLRTSIWLEEPEADNPFAARAAHCHGFDVYGEMLGQARWVDMLYLLLRGEPPTSQRATLLEALAVALANPGPRDPAVHAAMCAGVGGSTAAATLSAALAVGAGQYTGAREVYLAVDLWRQCGTDLAAWTSHLASDRATSDPACIWSAPEHLPGFDPHWKHTASTVAQALALLARLSPGHHLGWLRDNLLILESACGMGLTMTGVAAATFADLQFTAHQAEMLHLLLRLPGAAAHALEQQQLGHKEFPFFALDLTDDAQRGADA